MSDGDRITRVEAKLRRVQRYLVLSVAAWGLVVVWAFTPGEDSERFDVLDVERINIVEADGRNALVLANAERLPGPIVRGEEYPVEVSGGRESASGIIFFNHEETEAGGLIYRSEYTQVGMSAGGSFTFDRMNQDQVVQLSYQEQGAGVFSGLQVFDRPEQHIKPVLDAARAHHEGEIDQEELVRLVEPELEGSARRVRVGSANGTALLEMNDTRGMPRISLVVDSMDIARLEFRDSTGAIVMRLPDTSPPEPSQSDTAPAGDQPAGVEADLEGAEESAEAWLAYIDAGEYRQSWEEVAEFVRGVVTPEQWENAIGQVRDPLGAVVERSLRQTEHTTELQNLPEGEYLIITYDTTFEGGEQTELVIVQRTADGVWQPIEYVLRP